MSSIDLGQAQLDAMARDVAIGLSGIFESVTWGHKATATSPFVNSTVSVRFEQYRQYEIDLQLILRNDKKTRAASSTLGFVPGLYDELTRSDGTKWRVMNYEGGLGYPWYIVQTRQIT